MNKIFVFGSIVKGNFNPKTSDVDLIVELEDLPPSEKGEILMKLWSEMEGLFARKVNLLTSLNIKNPYLYPNLPLSRCLISVISVLLQFVWLRFYRVFKIECDDLTKRCLQAIAFCAVKILSSLEN